MKKIINYNQAKKIVQRATLNGQTVLFKTGCFDILHYGHVQTLMKAKQMADILIVGLGSDRTLKSLKGNDRPYFLEQTRANMLAALECVDYVVPLREPHFQGVDHHTFLEKVRPHYWYIPFNDNFFEYKKQLAKEFGIKLKIQKEIPKNPKDNLEFSSSKMIKDLNDKTI